MTGGDKDYCKVDDTKMTIKMTRTKAMIWMITKIMYVRQMTLTMKILKGTKLSGD